MVWEYIVLNDRKTKQPVENPKEVIDKLTDSLIHKYLRVSDETTHVLVGYCPKDNVLPQPHYHLTPNKGHLWVASFATAKPPELLGADSRSVTYSIEDLTATVHFLPE